MAPKRVAKSPAKSPAKPPAKSPRKSPAKERVVKSPAKSPARKSPAGPSPRNRRASIGAIQRWTPLEEARLRALVLENTQKGRWTVIAEALGTNRTAAGELPTFFPNSHLVSTSETVPLTRVLSARRHSAVQQHYTKYCQGDIDDMMGSPEPPEPSPMRSLGETEAETTSGRIARIGLIAFGAALLAGVVAYHYYVYM
jgi:hypothetical protein